MLSRNLIYTGLTRAKKLAIVVGPQKAIALAIEQVKDRERYTLLSHRLSSRHTPPI
jgi:exodeoxyribonuclease V alpha subunit